MATRTSQKTVTFSNPVVLDGVDGVLPAGSYIVETDEELLEGLSFLAYRRTGTLIHVGYRPGYPGLALTVAIDPGDLEDALQCDRTSQATPIIQTVGCAAPTGIAGEEADLQAIERAEDEGMIARPRAIHS